MGRNSLPVPSKEDLQKFSSRKEIAENYGVSSYTVINWLKQNDLYCPKQGFGPHKLTKDVANIRKDWKLGMSIKDLAKKYQVTFATISRIVHNKTYKEHSPNNTSIVSVIYNPNTKMNLDKFIQ